MISHFCILIASLIGFNYYAQALEFRYVNALAPLNLTQMENGDALQRAALQKPDLLMMYGSSELTLLPTPYQAINFSQNIPPALQWWMLPVWGYCPSRWHRNSRRWVLTFEGRRSFFPLCPAHSSSTKNISSKIIPIMTLR
jgi:hypothetical protein